MPPVYLAGGIFTFPCVYPPRSWTGEFYDTPTEYAVGILAAVTFALVLLRIFNDNRFFEGTFKIVLKILNWVSGRI